MRRIGSRHYARSRLHRPAHAVGSEKTERVRKAAAYILEHQNEDGGWSTYKGGPTNLSASVKAYFGLKLAGYGADHAALRARAKNYS